VTRLLALLAATAALLAPASVARTDALRLVRVASGLRSPVYVTGLRSQPGRLYVVEQAGRIVVLQGGRVRAEPFLDIRSLVLSGGEQGLLSVAFDPGVTELAHVKPGMILNGVVTNVAAFGAFVDVGVHQDGLVHVSELANRFVKDPGEVVRVGDRVRVKVLSVDLQRRRIGLSLKALAAGSVG